MDWRYYPYKEAVEPAPRPYMFTKTKGFHTPPKDLKTIIYDPESAFSYASLILKGRWFEAEPYIMQDAYYAYHYARCIIKSRWLEAEPVIMRSGRWAYMYALIILERRWLEAEDFIAADGWWVPEYIRDFREAIENDLNNPNHKLTKIDEAYVENLVIDDWMKQQGE